MVMLKWDFLWLVLLAWAIASLTFLTNGWQFLLGNNNVVGVRLGSILAIILTLVGLWRSLFQLSEPLVVRIVTWVLAVILISLLFQWLYLAWTGF